MRCDAPKCEREAVFLASGTDYDDTPFADLLVCESCAEYLVEAGQERVTLNHIDLTA
jgi:hypothetical protein